jgi:hypothetical protein
MVASAPVLILAGGASRGAATPLSGLLIDAADFGPGRRPPVLLAGEFEYVGKYARQGGLRIVRLDWPDFRAPDLPKEFWEDLIREFRPDEPVHVRCTGGHGRTGTALSIIVSLLNLVPEGECPVEWVRRHYCKKAVESYEQILYIRDITGRAVTAEPQDDLLFLGGLGRAQTEPETEPEKKPKRKRFHPSQFLWGHEDFEGGELTW